MYEQHVSSFEGEVYKQTTNLIHTLPHLIVSIESILKKLTCSKDMFIANQFYKEKNKSLMVLYCILRENLQSVVLQVNFLTYILISLRNNMKYSDIFRC